MCGCSRPGRSTSTTRRVRCWRMPAGGHRIRRRCRQVWRSPTTYLDPLAAHPAIAPHIVFGATVDAVTRAGHDKVASAGRDAAPFVVRWRDADGGEHRAAARAVIDASGTWDQPNPIGTDGLPVAGERENLDRIAYGIPDVLGRDRDSYAGKRVLVVGGGHSAINVALDLLAPSGDRARHPRDLGAPARPDRPAARRRPERPAPRARRARPRGKARDRRRKAPDARAVRGRTHRANGGGSARLRRARRPADLARRRPHRGRNRVPPGARNAARAAHQRSIRRSRHRRRSRR